MVECLYAVILAKFTGSHHLDIKQNSPRMPKTSFNFRTKLHNFTITMFRTRPHSQSHLETGAHGNEYRKTPLPPYSTSSGLCPPALALQGCSQPTLPLDAASLLRVMLLPVIPHRPVRILCTATAAQHTA